MNILEQIRIESFSQFKKGVLICTIIFGTLYIEMNMTDNKPKMARQPDFVYNDSKEFIEALDNCISWLEKDTIIYQRIPREITIAQAILESDYGNSRFATEGNNLFGIRTWGDHPGMLPKGFPKNNPWQVRVFPSKCASVKEYVRILNNHPAYEDFRSLRTKQLVMNNNMDAIALIKTLTKFSTTPDYADRVIRIIERVRKLENTVATDKAVNEPKKKVPPKEKVSNIVLPKDKPEEIK